MLLITRCVKRTRATAARERRVDELSVVHVGGLSVIKVHQQAGALIDSDALRQREGSTSPQARFLQARIVGAPEAVYCALGYHLRSSTPVIHLPMSRSGLLISRMRYAHHRVRVQDTNLPMTWLHTVRTLFQLESEMTAVRLLEVARTLV